MPLIMVAMRPCCYAGSFMFQPGKAELLLGVLPPFMHVPAQDCAEAILRSTLEVLDSEIRSALMGASVMTHRLADILLGQALRAYAESGDAQARTSCSARNAFNRTRGSNFPL